MIMSFDSTLSLILNNGLNNMEQTNPKLIQGRYKVTEFASLIVVIFLRPNICNDVKKIVPKSWEIVVMYSGSKSWGRARFRVSFSGSGINISGTSPSGFRGFGDV